MDEEAVVEITIEGDAGVVAFKATSISNADGIAAAAQQIRQFISERHPRRIVFDFEGVKFFSSQVLGLLLEVRSRLGEYKGQVVISGINPQLYRVFKITNLDKIFRFFPDRGSAISAKARS